MSELERRWSRRTFLALGASLGAGFVLAPSVARAGGALPTNPFTLGVGSGDPDPTSVVLWTRLTGMGLPESVDVTWEAATAVDFAQIVARGTVTTTAAIGHAVHVIAEIDGPVIYRFRAGGFTSPIGRAAPVPAQPTELRLATASCQHYETGFYAAHRDIAEWAPDLVAFLGDFIYEGGPSPLGGNVVRVHEGPEPMDLAGYRTRYATYLSDAHLQAARAACPWLVIWDDHEVENNYAALTPNDPAEPAAFAARRAAAYQAWWEHQPVRLAAPVDGQPFPIHRGLAWGGVADLIALDGRQFRSDQVCNEIPPLTIEPACADASLPDRSMLGTEQEGWLNERLATSTATWPTLVQQTVMTDLRIDDIVLNFDQWDGYAPARQRLLDAAVATTERLIVLTGDIHLAGIGVLPGVGVEFVTTSLSSSANVPVELEATLAGFANVRGAEITHRGYTRHVVTPQRWTAEYRIVDDIADPASTVSTWQTFAVDANQRDVVTPV